MTQRRLLVTGPVDSLDEYAQAARDQGWEAIEFPLLSIQTLASAAQPIVDARFDWICVTSRHALPFLERACADDADLCSVPCAVVGERSGAAVEALGLHLGFAPCTNANDLAVELLERGAPGACILWPRGDLSDELARLLRAAQYIVIDPIAYSTRAIADPARPPRTDAVFFASPSAVRAWHSHAQRWADEDQRSAALSSEEASHERSSNEPSRADDSNAAAPPPLAIAIGATTFDALLSETRASFFDTISLPRPSPEALGVVLAHLDPPRR